MNTSKLSTFSLSENINRENDSILNTTFSSVYLAKNKWLIENKIIFIKYFTDLKGKAFYRFLFHFYLFFYKIFSCKSFFVNFFLKFIFSESNGLISISPQNLDTNKLSEFFIPNLCIFYIQKKKEWRNWDFDTYLLS